jgi:hydrogenase/urease accessory protein HupE
VEVRAVIDYLWLGFKHMVMGWDHLLFIAGVVLFAGGIKPASKLVSIFVLGHSITLMVATLAGWRIDAEFIDAIIALSLVYVGVQGMRGRPTDLRITAGIVFAFGLVHGLGLSTRLQDLGLPDGGLVPRILVFNVGVELGQLTALLVIVGIVRLVLRLLNDSPSSAEAHDAKPFYPPDKNVPLSAFGHVIGHGYVVVRYRPDIDSDTLARLKALATKRSEYAIVSPDPKLDQPIKVYTAYRQMTCGNADVDAVIAFHDDWLEEVGI